MLAFRWLSARSAQSEVDELKAMISGKSPVIGRSGIARVE